METTPPESVENNHKLTVDNIDRIICWVYRKAMDTEMNIKAVRDIMVQFTIYQFESCTVDFSQQKIECLGNIECSKRDGLWYNNQYKNSHLMGGYNSYVESVFQIGEDIDGTIPIPSNLQLVICHLSSYIQSGSFDAPINIDLNGHEICRDFAPRSHGYITDKFNLDPAMLKLSGNTIKVSYALNGRSNYWIKRLTVEVAQE